jgi:uncharacterized protein YcfJ
MHWKRAAALVLMTGATIAPLAAAPTPASAQSDYDYHAYQDCRRAQSGNTVAGAIIGGIAGGVIGNSVAGHGDRGAGTALGAGVGAAVGAGVGSSSTSCGYDYNRRTYDYDRRCDYDRSYYSSPDYNGYYSSPQTVPDYYRNSSPDSYYDPDAY